MAGVLSAVIRDRQHLAKSSIRPIVVVRIVEFAAC